MLKFVQEENNVSKWRKSSSRGRGVRAGQGLHCRWAGCSGELLSAAGTEAIPPTALTGRERKNSSSKGIAADLCFLSV